MNTFSKPALLSSGYGVTGASEFLFRFDDFATGDEYATGLEVELRKFAITKRTPRGFWIDHYGMRRFVLAPDRKHGGKRFAYPDIVLAKESFIRRKQAQIGHAEQTLRRANYALDIMAGRFSNPHEWSFA